MADWGDGVSASCTVGPPNCPLARAMDGHIMRYGTIGSCQSAATSKIVSAAGHESDSCKWRYSKCPDLLLSRKVVRKSLTRSVFAIVRSIRVTILHDSVLIHA